MIDVDVIFENMSKKLGTVVIDPYGYNHSINQDNIRKFYSAMGYNRTFKYDRIPLTFLQTFTTGSWGGGEGLHMVLVEETYKKLKEITVSDNIYVKVTAKELKKINTKIYGKSILQTDFSEIYVNDEKIAELESKFIRFKRGVPPVDVNVKTWTQNELDNLLELQEKQKAPLNSFEKIPDFTIGPYTIEDFVMWEMSTGAGPFIRAFEDRLRIAKKVPGLYLRDEHNNPISYANVHWYIPAANDIGKPLCFDFGRQRISVVEKSLLRFTNYDIKELNLKSQDYVVTGEILIIKSVFDKKDNKRTRLKIDCFNQDGIKKAEGYAILEPL